MLLAAASLAPAAAQEIGDPRQGRALAREVCAVCHAVDAGASNSPRPDAPTFETIARTPGMSEIALNAALHTSHRTMPNLILTAPEARNVIAYILSLK
jgi:mono/diheme cytochrome c family protein